MQKKNVLIIISLVGILISGAFLFFHSGERGAEKAPGQNATLSEKSGKAGQNEMDISKEAIAGWKTCRNEEYGYEFKYPREWYVYNSKESYSKYSPIIVKKGNNCVGSYLFVSNISLPKSDSNLNQIEQGFAVEANNQERLSKTIYAGSQSLDEYFSKVTPGFLKAHKVIKKGYIDKEPALWLKQKKVDAVPFILVFHNGTSFTIRASILNPDPFFDTILSTFKFID